MLLVFAVTIRKTVSRMCRKMEVAMMRLIDVDDLFCSYGELKEGGNG